MEVLKFDTAEQNITTLHIRKVIPDRDEAELHGVKTKETKPQRL